MTLELGRERMNMAKNLWDKEYNRVYRELVRDYLDDGYDLAEAKYNAKRDTKEVMQDQLDFVEELYDNTLNDLD
tara:strand:- start:287 stop:508 length:222 start_codon:yes stop_codon:yes gene_type:complete